MFSSYKVVRWSGFQQSYRNISIYCNEIIFLWRKWKNNYHFYFKTNQIFNDIVLKFFLLKNSNFRNKLFDSTYKKYALRILYLYFCVVFFHNIYWFQLTILDNQLDRNTLYFSLETPLSLTRREPLLVTISIFEVQFILNFDIPCVYQCMGLISINFKW